MVRAAGLLIGLWLLAVPGPVQSQAPTVAALPPGMTAGRGAILPFVEYEAELAATSGAIIGPDRTFGALAAEASGRRAVRLDARGQDVRFRLQAEANAITVRYAVPDAVDCRAADTEIGVYSGDRRIAGLKLTPCYSWYYGDYPFTHDAGADGAHHFYDHARLLLGEVLPAGAEIGLRFEDARTPWVVIDLADFERVDPPAAPPPMTLSVLDFGADASGVRDSRRAFQRALDRGRRDQRPVWAPPGEYRIDGHLVVDRVTLAGAGPWHTVLRGRGVGVYGHRAPRGSRQVTLRDFAIIGEVMDRDDKAQLNGVGGALSQSLIANLYIQHTKVGVWVDGPLDGLTLSGLRIFDQAADGVNFHQGVTNSTVENTFVRNTGDDGLAMWSHRTPNRGNAFRRNTVIAPVLANGIAIYGGEDILVVDNLVADSVTRGGGLHLGARFDATPLQGDILFSGNTLVRTGSIDPVWRFGVGAVWLYALDRPITGARIRIEDTVALYSTDAAFQVLGQAIEGLAIDGARIAGGAGVLQVRAPGEAVVGGVAADGLTGVAVDTHSADFRLIDAGGNRGWRPVLPQD